VHEDGWAVGGVASTPDWVVPSALRRVFLEGTTGLEAFQCTERTDWCYGWLRVSRGRVMWVVVARGNGARLSTIEVFMQSFRPVASK